MVSRVSQWVILVDDRDPTYFATYRMNEDEDDDDLIERANAFEQLRPDLRIIARCYGSEPKPIFLNPIALNDRLKVIGIGNDEAMTRVETVRKGEWIAGVCVPKELPFGQVKLKTRQTTKTAGRILSQRLREKAGLGPMLWAFTSKSEPHFHPERLIAWTQAMDRNFPL